MPQHSGSRLLLATGGGLLGGSAFEPVGIGYLAPVAVATLVLAIEGQSWRRSAALGGCYGAAYMGLLLYWMAASIGVGAWLALSLVQATWFAGLGAAFYVVRRMRAWPIWSALLWAGVELLRSAWPFGGLPWGRLGFAAIDTLWAHSLPLVGVTGVSALLALIGTCLAWSVVAGPRLTRGVAAAMVALVLATLAPALVGPSPSTAGTARVAVVQGNVPGDGDDLARHHRQVTRNHETATQLLASEVAAGTVERPDFVIWPENSTAVDPFRDDEANASIRAAEAAIGAPILLGSIVDGDTPETSRNQGLVWSGGQVTDRYTKQHLVPFGEYVPLRPLLGGLSDRLEAISRDMQPGGPAEPLQIAGVSVADALCFDVAYDDVIGNQVRRGAELVVVQTSNAMFVGTAQPEQQFAISRARALESGRSLVVSSVNGISGVIAADGGVQYRMPTRRTTTHLTEVRLHDHTTLAVRLGPWSNRLVLASAGLALAWGGATLLRRQRTVLASTPAAEGDDRDTRR